MQYLLQSKFKLGADAAAAAGPVGRDAQAATDLTMRAQILTYSRSRGLFLGVSLNGAVVRQDNGGTRAFYGKDWTFYSLLNGEVAAPPESHALLSTVERYAPTRNAALHPAPAGPAPIVTPADAPVPAPAADTTPAAAPAPTAPVDPAAVAAPATEPTKAPTPAPAATPTSATPTDPAGRGSSLR